MSISVSVNVYHARTDSREKRKGGIFSIGGSNSRGGGGDFCRYESAKFYKKDNILHAFITICLFRLFELFCTNAFELLTLI